MVSLLPVIGLVLLLPLLRITTFLHRLLFRICRATTKRLTPSRTTQTGFPRFTQVQSHLHKLLVAAVALFPKGIMPCSEVISIAASEQMCLETI